MSVCVRMCVHTCAIQHFFDFFCYVKVPTLCSMVIITPSMIPMLHMSKCHEDAFMYEYVYSLCPVAELKSPAWCFPPPWHPAYTAVVL